MATVAGKVTRLNPISRVILQGLYDVQSPWHKLLGLPHILKTIWLNVMAFWRSKISVVDNDEDGYSFFKLRRGFFRDSPFSKKGCIAKFPKPKDIDINMMPFVMAKNFRKTKLPEYLKPYYKQVARQCITGEEVGKIGYITIQESHVDEGASQRTPGIHMECPSVPLLENKKGILVFVGYGSYRWGDDNIKQRQIIDGGIYMASNVDYSCRVWNCQIKQPEAGCVDVVGNLGNIEHLRQFLPYSSDVMAANRIYWLTDRTPYESLPLRKGTYAQFFRLVTSQLSVWYEDYSTKNPLGVVPDPKITKVLKGTKFDGSCYEVDEPASA